MSKTRAVLLLLCLAPCAAAQKDKIHWTDGKVTDGCRIRDYTVREITYHKGGNTESQPSDRVARVECQRVREAYRRGYGAGNPDEAYSLFRAEREARVKRGDCFVAQFGFLEEARLLRANSQYNECFATLEQLAKDCPESAFVPELFRFKLDYYLAQGAEKARSAKTVATKYRETAERNAWPQGFQLEAAYYEVMADAAAGAISPGVMESRLRDLLDKTDGTYPLVANRVKLQMANLLRRAKRLDDARAFYRQLVDAEFVDEATRAAAYVGLGYAEFESGDPSNREPYKRALLYFLRAYLETPDAPREIRAEALYNAIQACEKWRGPDSAAMARRLRAYLRRDFAETSWAKRGG